MLWCLVLVLAAPSPHGSVHSADIPLSSTPRLTTCPPPPPPTHTHTPPSSFQDCAILLQCLGELAARHPNTKFVRIVSTDCIPGYPDANLPTLLLYRDTKCLKTLVGLRSFGGRATSPDLVALTLNSYGEVCGDADDLVAQVKGLMQKELEERELGSGDESSDFE